VDRSTLKRFSFCLVLIGIMTMSVATTQASLVVKLILELKEGKYIILEEKKAGPTWLVLNAGETIATELKASVVGELDSSHLTMLTHLLGLTPAVSCSNFTLVGFSLEKEGNLTTGGKITFTGCEVYGDSTLEEPLGCSVKSPGQAVGTLESNKLKGELYLHIDINGKAEETVIRIEPEVALGDFKTLRTEECAIPEVIPVRGVIYLKDALGQVNTHVVKHLIEQAPRGTLYLGAHTVEHLNTSLIGSAWLKLAGEHTGLKLSAMDP